MIEGIVKLLFSAADMIVASAKYFYQRNHRSSMKLLIRRKNELESSHSARFELSG